MFAQIGVKFAFLVETRYTRAVTKSLKQSCHPYVPLRLKKLISVEAVVSVRYFEYRRTFSFAGERHNFWELVCVDKGEIEIYDEKAWSVLRPRQIKFHKPNEFHSLRANGVTSPNVIVVSFVCPSPAMDFFKEKTLACADGERTMLSNIIASSRELFSTPLDDPYLLQMRVKKNAAPEAAQEILLNLEMLLLSLYKKYNIPNRISKERAAASYSRSRHENDVAERAISFFTKNMRRMISAGEICDELHISYDSLKSIFAHLFHAGPIAYFRKMRVEEIKREIRNSAMNISELSEHFGYSSIHYFSRQFKRETGMSPREYAASIKARTEKD